MDGTRLTRKGTTTSRSIKLNGPVIKSVLKPGDGRK